MLLALGSCVKEQLAVFNPATDATAPVLGTYTVNEDGITANYTPGVFSINENIAPKHAFALVEVDGEAVSKILTSSNKDGVLTITTANLSKNLVSLGYAEGSTHALKIVVRATMQDTSKDNGINGFIDSEGAIEIAKYLIYIPEVVGSPYADYTEQATDWTVIGALSNYDIGWNGDLVMWTDGEGRYVAPHVKLAAADEFKFRKDQSWEVNYGGGFGGLDTEFSVEQDGANIVVGADGVYDLYLDVNNATATVTAAYDPYAEYTQESTWTVIGALSNYSINWNGDLPMISDGANHVALGVKLAAADEFKFRKDGSWEVNLGGDFGGLDNEFSVEQDGANIVVGAEGEYDLFVNPEAGTAKVAETAGMKVSTVFGGSDEPGTGGDVTYSLIGDFNGWGDDVMMKASGDVWTAYLTTESATTFKIRKDKDWVVSYGGPEANLDFYDNDGENDSYKPTLGETFAAGDKNVWVDAGIWKVVLDLADAENPTITVSIGETWSLIGDFNGWSGDIDMTDDGGIWTGTLDVEEPTTFKIRKNKDWAVSYGGPEANLDFYDNDGENDSYKPALGEAFTAGDKNVWVDAGSWIITFDLTVDSPTIKVEAAEVPDFWGVIGNFNGWGGDAVMTEVMPGIWVSETLTIESAGWKVRMNGDWDVNRGGALNEQGEFAEAVPGGADINLTGTFKVIYNANNETIGTLLWGVVGSVASIDGFSWNNDVPMNLASDGKWYSIPVALTTSDEIKIRQNAAWTVDRGGACTEADAAFEVTQGGSNIKAPADGTYMVVYDPTAETITLSTKFWGLIGAFNDWGGDKFMLFDGTKWVAYNQLLSGAWKIRQASSWDVNRGGVFSAADTAFDAVDGGADITVSLTDPYDVVYDPAAEVIFVGDAANYTAAAPSGITIDGDFSDWAEIDGLSSEDGVYRSFKAVSDGTYLYFYSKRTWNDGLWKDSSGGYFYYELDTDNDETTGTNDVNGNTGYGIETWMYLYLFTGSSSAPTFASSPKGSAYPSSDVIANVTAAGATDGTLIETEVRVPIADVGVKKGDTVRIYTWGNKSASNFKSNKESVLVTVE